MNSRYWGLLVTVVSLLAIGCQKPTHPAFSPNGSKVVYAQDTKLFVRGSSGPKRVGADPAGDVAWSADGSRLAYLDTRRRKTVIYDLRSARSWSWAGFTEPYAWTPGALICMRDAGDRKPPSDHLVLLDPLSGSVRREVKLPAIPAGMESLGIHGTLAWDSENTWLIRGSRIKKLPGLSMFDPVSSSADGRWVTFARKFVPPFTHLQRVELWRWDSAGNAAPVKLERIHVTRSLDELTYVADVQGSRLGVLAMSMARFKPAPGDSENLPALLDQFDLLNLQHMSGSGDDSAIGDQANQILERGTMTFEVMTRRPGRSWRRAFVASSHGNSGPGMIYIDLSSDGKRLAVSGDDGTRIFLVQ